MIMLCADLESLHIVYDVGIHARPVDSSLCYVLHFFNAFVAVM